jgi:hypothetical protein
VKANVNKLQGNTKNKNILEIYKGINEFKMGYQSRAYVIKNDCTIMADTTSILSRWKKFYSNLLHVNQGINLEGSEIYTVEPTHPRAWSCRNRTDYRELKKQK